MVDTTTIVQDFEKQIKEEMIHKSISLEARTPREKALIFWYCIQKILKPGYLSKYEIVVDGEFAIRTKILSSFTAHKNKDVALVALLESLPTIVFRRVLWFYNIDFQTLESFLRRITPTQRNGIKQTYDDLYGTDEKTQTIPVCFTADWKTKLRQKLYRSPVTLSSLVEQTIVDDRFDSERYTQKGSIAYDFLGLDFGFNVYTDVDSDKKLPENIAKQFLMPKNQQNDFTVNKEDGLYWWLYKTVRSNYLWRRNKAVELKPAICPGFWFTLLSWFFFMFISPLSGVVAVVGFGSTMHDLLVLFFGAIGLVTPTILITACIKYLIEKINGEIDEKYFTKLFVGLAITCMGTALAAVTVLVWLCMYYLNYESIALAVYFTAFIWFYGVYMVHHKEVLLPTCMPILGIPTVVYAIGNVVVFFRSELLVILQGIGSFLYSNAGNILLIATPILVYIVFFAWLYNYLANYDVFAKDEKSYNASKKIWKYVEFFSVFLFVFFIVFVAIFIVFGFTYRAYLFHPTALLLALGGMVIPFMMMLVSKPDTMRKRALVYVNTLSSKNDSFYWYSTPKQILAELAKNPWIQSKNDYTVTQKVTSFILKYNGDFEKIDLDHLYRIDEKGYQLIDEYSGLLPYHVYNNKELFVVFTQHMCNGVSFDDAKKAFEKRNEQIEQFQDNAKKLYDYTLGFFVVRPILFVYGLLEKMFSDIWNLLRLFSTYCPHVTQPVDIREKK